MISKQIRLLFKQHYIKFNIQNHLFNNDNIPINDNVVIAKQLFTFFSLPTYTKDLSQNQKRLKN